MTQRNYVSAFAPYVAVYSATDRSSSGGSGPIWIWTVHGQPILSPWIWTEVAVHGSSMDLDKGCCPWTSDLSMDIHELLPSIPQKGITHGFMRGVCQNYARCSDDPVRKNPWICPWIVQMDLDFWIWTARVSKWIWTEACPVQIRPLPSLRSSD